MIICPRKLPEAGRTSHLLYRTPLQMRVECRLALPEHARCYLHLIIIPFILFLFSSPVGQSFSYTCRHSKLPYLSTYLLPTNTYAPLYLALTSPLQDILAFVIPPQQPVNVSWITQRDAHQSVRHRFEPRKARSLQHSTLVRPTLNISQLASRLLHLLA